MNLYEYCLLHNTSSFLTPYRYTDISLHSICITTASDDTASLLVHSEDNREVGGRREHVVYMSSHMHLHVTETCNPCCLRSTDDTVMTVDAHWRCLELLQQPPAKLLH